MASKLMTDTYTVKHNTTNNASTTHEIYFDLTPIFGDTTSIICALVLSTICDLAILPVFYGIIWYEVNSHIRTLINQVLALACWASLLYAIWTLVHTFARFFIGPLGDVVCGLDVIVMNVVGMCEMIFMTCIVVAKYVFVHLMKNPVALDDEFFKLVIGLMSAFLSFLTQLVFIFSPGRNPLRFYICVGKIPLRYITENVPVKFNWPFYMLLMITCLIMAAVFLMRKFAKKRVTNQSPSTTAPVLRIFASILKAIIPSPRLDAVGRVDLKKTGKPGLFYIYFRLFVQKAGKWFFKRAISGLFFLN